MLRHKKEKRERTPIQKVREFLPVGQKAFPEKPRKFMRRMSKKRSGQVKIYGLKARAFLQKHLVCQVWLKDNNWRENSVCGGIFYERVFDHEGIRHVETRSASFLIEVIGAPRSTQVHHKDKRRGARLNDETKWLAVCAENHRRIEDNKSWARANGFLEDF